jgi:FtsZ-binding cell division protein ZapB
MEAAQKERPAYVRFERQAREDRAASLIAGHFVAVDADFVLITPVGSKDEVVKPVDEWLKQIKTQVREGRMPSEHEIHYVRIYEAWKKGEELPVDGTPIKGWPVLSPAQQTVVLAANVRTVEDLAQANGEALTRIGMQSREIKAKAEHWLKASKDVGVVVQEIAALRVENERLKTDKDEQQKKLDALVARVKALEAKPVEA